MKMKIKRLLEATPATEALELQTALLELGWDNVNISHGSPNEYGTPAIVLLAVRKNSGAESARYPNRRRIKVVGYIDDGGFYWSSHKSSHHEFDGLTTKDMIDELTELYGSVT